MHPQSREEHAVMLTNIYLVALGIPLILLLCGAIARKVARGNGWMRSDFFLGVEIALAALGSAMVYCYDLHKLNAAARTVDVTVADKIVATASFLVIAFFLLLCLLSTHQDWHSRNQDPRGQFIWLGLISNFIGIALFAAFVMLVKGV